MLVATGSLDPISGLHTRNEYCLARAIRLEYRGLPLLHLEPILAKGIEDIAWSTQVWIANEAEQVINFGTAL